MSPAFISGVGEHLSNADITFDRFHIAKKLGEAVDAVRRDEAKARPLLLRKTRWIWLTNRDKLSEVQQRELFWLTRPSLNLATARAHRWREDFQGFYDLAPDQAEAYLTRWCAGAMRSRLQPLKDFVGTVRRNWAGILAWHHSHLTTGLLEGTNSAHPGRQGPGLRLPQHELHDHCHPSHRRETTPTVTLSYPHGLAESQAKPP